MIYENVKALCDKNGTTVYALTKALGFGYGTISRWRTSSPSADKLKAVADYFGVTVDALLKGGR